MENRDERLIGVVGAGAWGAALAQCAAQADHPVVLWGRDPARMAAIAESRRHPRLEGMRLDRRVECVADMAALAPAAAVVLAVPAQTLRPVLAALAGVLRPDAPAVIAAKGIERESAMTMPEVVSDLDPRRPVAVLSGPTFAGELARGLPAAATLACRDIALAEELAAVFHGVNLRLYASDDVTGAALGGAVKNVLAIAAGAVIGAGLGSNARAGVIARGLAEMTRLGEAMGARTDTLAGLSGLGDLVLSCTDSQSRNFSFGHALARGETPDGQLVEGALTVGPLLARAARHGADMPIAEAVDAVVNQGAPLDRVIARLLARPGRRESTSG
ncbi:NAD(P)H-dependent glycerol-3-phosphate dehydrogenase [Minwuia thermotolerans]|uniref:Glycerol-3-phosphate dehydrogenase [NAD(P)+] n=1 Tax=Minwuia thermotolerans TaxID=2056226 RepID=A0A2M9G2B9_9PROT|nr:NAD(P)H-dependent glycerol-3-phosphate dehydrogenase [Minwuia thermotolerans]PJK29863.1 glycerol-3-phosphate dehydrogenase [Minwuia thermotolerans]